MIKKYELVDESGRKRLRALRNFSVQGRDVNVHDLGGYVYDEKTLSQEGNCWIFSGSLEYPGVHVMDEAIVDMGINLPKSNARPKATIISGNSRIMGAISFETQSLETTQTPAMFEQGGYTATVGAIPVKEADGSRIRAPFRLFGGTVGRVTITNPLYQARVVFIGEDGLVTGTSGEWVTGGPSVIVPVASPYFLVEVRKTAITALTPADVTTAGVSLRTVLETQINLFNSSIVPVYNGSVVNANNIFRFSVSGTLALPTITRIRNSYVRAECVYDDTNTFVVNTEFTKVNYNMVLTAGVYNYVSGSFRNTNMNSPASVPGVIYVKRLFDVSDCPDFEYSTVTFPDLAAMIASGKTFYFKNCNMPVGSAIHYYDPKVNVWDNIDFTKAMADLGKTLPLAGTVRLVSSNKQGMCRLYDVTPKAHGALVESISSLATGSFSIYADTYDSVLHKDCTIAGVFTITGRNVFGGTLGGASKITNTTETARVIDGSFRIEGNAQVTDTPLKGAGYIGGNAELKNGNVEGYVYMDGNAKYIPAAVTNPAIIKHLIMTGDSKVLKQQDVANNHVNMELSDNAVIDSMASTDRGLLKMSGNAYLYSAGITVTPVVYGTLEMKDDAKQVGGTLTTHGDVTLCGGYDQASGALNITGKRTIANVPEITAVELPPTKITW